MESLYFHLAGDSASLIYYIQLNPGLISLTAQNDLTNAKLNSHVIRDTRLSVNLLSKYARPAQVAGSGHLTALKPSARNSFCEGILAAL